MAVEVLYDEQRERACLYCNTSGWVFGPVIHPTATEDAQDAAEAFLWYCLTHRSDPRKLSFNELETLYEEFQIEVMASPKLVFGLVPK